MTNLSYFALSVRPAVVISVGNKRASFIFVGTFYRTIKNLIAICVWQLEPHSQHLIRMAWELLLDFLG